MGGVMLISVEGMDGVGKSTIVGAISHFLNIPVIEKPIKSLLILEQKQSHKIKEKIYGEYSENIQAMYYLMGYLSALELGNQNDFILDRGFLSTYYFSYCKKNSNLFDFFAENYGFPDLTVVLYASITERIKRIKNRDKNDHDLNKGRLYVDDYTKYFNAIEKYSIPSVIINTEKLSKVEVVKLVIEIIDYWNLNQSNRDKIMDMFSISNLHKCGDLSYDELHNNLIAELENKKISIKRMKRDEKNYNK